MSNTYHEDGTATVEALDKVSGQIIWNRLVAMMDLGASILRRQAVSTLVRECNDFGLVLLDEKGRVLAEPRTALAGPARIGDLVLEKYGDQIRPDDVFITNDAWWGTGHIQDVVVILPIFVEDSLIGFSASAAHVQDIGGRINDLNSASVYEEGIQIPLTRLYSGTEPNETVFAFLDANVRLPIDVRADIEAQVAANRMIVSSVHELLSEYGFRNFDEIGRFIFDTTRVAVGGMLERIPAGTWTAEQLVDGVEPPLTLKITVTHDGTRSPLQIDLTGSSPQQSRACNLPLVQTERACLDAIKSFIMPELPPNGAAHSGFELHAPLGTVVNPVYPAPTMLRHVVWHVLHPLLLSCLSQAVPEQAAAAPGTPGWIVSCVGHDRQGRPFADNFLQHGGLGATAQRDGRHASSYPVSATNAPVEVIESRFPIRFLRRSLRRGSGGSGKYRGGDGQSVEFVVEGEKELFCVLITNRTSVAAVGAEGGGAGSVGAAYLNGKELAMHEMAQMLQPGDVVRLELPGGGGYGGDEQ